MTRTDELLKVYESAEAEVKALEELGLESDEAKDKLANIEYQITKEVNKLDYWLTSVKQRINSLELYREQFKEAIKQIDQKIKTNENTINFIEDNVLPKLVNSKGKLDLGYKKYTLYESDGELVVNDQSQIPDQFIKTKVEQSIDKISLKKYVKDNNPSWAYIKKVKRVKVS